MRYITALQQKVIHYCNCVTFVTRYSQHCIILEYETFKLSGFVTLMSREETVIRKEAGLPTRQSDCNCPRPGAPGSLSVNCFLVIYFIAHLLNNRKH
uniref:Uncharacterized protein n=1 Tax=Sander lucioperca TaxID=283035 RepID=A0A8C9XNZ9_SANLU